MLGSHLSIAGGMVNALREARRLKMDCVQVFTANQRQWNPRPPTPSEQAEWLAELAAALGADLKGNGVPYLTVLDASGKAIANQETSSLEEGDHHDPAKVLAFLKQHQAEHSTAESVLSEGMKQAVAENKVVFLHFGAPWCVWCHRLEDWMARPEVNAVLGKDFVDAKIDVDRTVGGADLQKRYAGEKSGGIPWFAFVNARDDQVIITSVDAKGRNAGFPAEDFEIAHFGAMLTKACRNATPAEIDALLASLKAENKKPSSH